MIDMLIEAITLLLLPLYLSLLRYCDTCLKADENSLSLSLSLALCRTLSLSVSVSVSVSVYLSFSPSLSPSLSLSLSHLFEGRGKGGLSKPELSEHADRGLIQTRFSQASHHLITLSAPRCALSAFEVSGHLIPLIRLETS